jgi:2-iminobutanoate/2-iminopropanoate deaminase
MKRVITSSDAALPAGAYSQGTTNESLIFTAGQIAKTADGTSFLSDTMEVQTRVCIDNIKHILAEEGASLSDVLKTTVFLENIDDFEEMNRVYSEYFSEDPPARSAFEVARLPGGAKIEIEAVASKN